MNDINRTRSAQLFERSQQYFPGGVNSPVRAFRSVYGTPLFIERGDGCRLWDADGNEFIDFCCSWGPLILGHNHPAIRQKVTETLGKGMSFGAPTALENELAELILRNNPLLEKIRFVSSGTEAVMSAIRLARGYTKRNKIIKFEGCYHGHSDGLLVKAGSGLVTHGESSSAGVPDGFAAETIVVSLNDTEAVTAAFDAYPDDVAAVIIEGVPANNGLLIQDKHYIAFLRKITADQGALLIFDEVITGFRLGFGGAAAYYGIEPDILTYGKIIGGGMPVGMYGASARIMSNVSPEGPVYQAGTLSGNPVAMSAGIAQLTELLQVGFYERLNTTAQEFVRRIRTYAGSKGYPFSVVSIGSIFWFAFTKESVRRAEDIDPASMDRFKVFHRELLNRGIYLGPSGYEVGFVSAAHTVADLELALPRIFESLDKVFE